MVNIHVKLWLDGQPEDTGWLLQRIDDGAVYKCVPMATYRGRQSKMVMGVVVQTILLMGRRHYRHGYGNRAIWSLCQPSLPVTGCPASGRVPRGLDHISQIAHGRHVKIIEDEV